MALRRRSRVAGSSVTSRWHLRPPPAPGNRPPGTFHQGLLPFPKGRATFSKAPKPPTEAIHSNRG